MPLLKFLLLLKISLEMKFGIVRSRGRSNITPTVTQSKHIYKILFTHNSKRNLLHSRSGIFHFQIPFLVDQDTCNSYAYHRITILLNTVHGFVVKDKTIWLHWLFKCSWKWNGFIPILVRKTLKWLASIRRFSERNISHS